MLVAGFTPHPSVMALISLQEVSLAFGGPLILDRVCLQIDPGERVCLVGRNGEGKSSIMKLLTGELTPDTGEIPRQQGLRIAMLPQEVPKTLSGTVFDVVAEGLGPRGELLREFHSIGQRLAGEQDERLLKRLEQVQHALDTENGWALHRQVELVISTLKLDSAADAATLSGGLKRRVVLARALASDPDLLLLDEPTNHLDMDSIAWLEEFLIGQGRTLLFVTHDRMFLRRLATRIVELDRGRIHNWACDYDTWLERKTAALDAESAEWAREDKKLAEEEIWIRKGVKARRTRNEGRVRALKKLREERRARRERTGNVRFQVQEAERSGRLVIETEGAGFAYDGRTIFKNLDTLIMRGDRVGIIGPNGCGKTTLLQVLLGILPPTEGRVRHGTRLQVAYFDQLRADIDDSKSVLDNVAGGNDRISLNGKTRHVIGYLEDFLFSPNRARGPVTALSGGERNRLLLARLFAKPSNVLVMDEPTNDLDVETLELLEELLMGYEGTLLLVSHDRVFLNNVVTSTLVFEGDGRVKEYVGGYDDWLWQRKPAEDTKPAKPAPEQKKQKPQSAAKPRRLTFNEKRELDILPQKIESLENEQKSLYEVLTLPVMNPEDAERTRKAKTRIDEIDIELSAAFERWEILDSINRESMTVS